MVLIIERGDEVAVKMDAMSESLVASRAAGSDADPLDPYGDHPEATQQARTLELGVPDGMNLQESAMGVVP